MTSFTDLITQLMLFNAEDRLDPIEALQHPFFQDGAVKKEFNKEKGAEKTRGSKRS